MVPNADAAPESPMHQITPNVTCAAACAAGEAPAGTPWSWAARAGKVAARRPPELLVEVLRGTPPGPVRVTVAEMGPPPPTELELLPCNIKYYKYMIIDNDYV